MGGALEVKEWYLESVKCVQKLAVASYSLAPGYMKRNSQRPGREGFGGKVEAKDSKLGSICFLCSLSHLCGTEWLIWH